MKYMGSKRAMLQNGLGDLLALETRSAKRFVDLFAGSGAVAIHVARNFSIPVLAFDIQLYSAILSASVVSRLNRMNWENIWDNWFQSAHALFQKFKAPISSKITKKSVFEFRDWCENKADLPITKAYGGHYFSPTQSVWFDAFRLTMPLRNPARIVALAALIQAASQCAASPGHTAQPFQPTLTAKPFLFEAWNRNVVQRTKECLEMLAGQCAQKRGFSKVADANQAASLLRKGDLAFIDPPYSGVHYSRFYHVLETIARGHCGSVDGVGRYPAQTMRPRSNYSLRTESARTLDALLEVISKQRAKAILTFPDHECSNGLSGDAVRQIARKHFYVRHKSVKSKFSTLGGTGNGGRAEAGRAARQHANELMLILDPS